MDNTVERVNALSIAGFRGIIRIHKTIVDGFKGINIFVGRNNSGKSTLLEALYLLVSRNSISDILGRFPLGYVVKRRGWFGLGSLKGIIHNRFNKATLSAKINKTSIDTEIQLSREDTIKCTISKDGKPFTRIMVEFHQNGDHSIISSKKLTGLKANVVFIDWNIMRSYGEPEDVYSLLLESGGSEAEEYVVKTLKGIYRDLRGFKPLKSNNKWVLYAVLTDYSIPFYLLGDGLRAAFTYLALLGSVKKGIVLAEEPELHQHRSSMEVVAEAIIKSNTDHRNQIFLSTHSIELIDIILDKADKYGLEDDLAIFRVSLKNGVLHYRKYSYSEALESRRELELDLRG